MIRWLIILIGFWISSNHLSAQNSLANTWAFGVSAGLKFGSNPPTPLSWQALRTIGGSAVLNDVNGNLLVYSNGDGNYVGPYSFIDSLVLGTFNSNNQFISIIDANIQSNTQEIQPCMFVPQPLKDSVYYLFSSLLVGNFMPGGGRYCLAYSKFKANSRKEIVLLQPTTRLSGIPGLDIIYGGLTGCRHSNGQDYWIITSTKQYGQNGPFIANQNLIFAYLLTDTGLRAPVISVLPPDSFFISGNVPFAASNLKSSYNGRLLARCSGNTVELLQFNPNTGQASLLRNINLSQNGQHLWKSNGVGAGYIRNPIFYPINSNLIDTTQFYEYTAYGLAFSPNDSLLYVTNCQEASRPSGRYYGYGIYQFQLYAPDVQASLYPLPQSRFYRNYVWPGFTVIAGQNLTLNTGFGSLQMGPDGMIYASRYAQQHLYRIRNPNGIGAACQFDSTDKVSVAPNYTMLGLPHYLDALLIPPRYAGCAPLRVNFANPRPGGLWYEWRFVEDSTFSSSPTPVRTYTSGGQYGVVVRVGLPGGQVDSSFFTVMVYDPPSRLYRFKADTVCLGAMSRFSLDTMGLQNLRFRVLLNGTPLPEDSAWFYHARLATAGTHTVRVIATNTFTQCQDTTDYPLVVRPKPTALFALSDSVSCAPASLPIQAAGADSAWLLSARLGRRALSLSANTWRDTLAYPNATHDTLRLVRTNSFGCSDTSQAKRYHVLARPKASFSLFDTAFCGFVYVRLLDSSRNVFNPYASGSLRWDFGDGSPPLLLTQSSGGAVFHAFQQSGVFDLRLIASNGRCSDTLLRPQAILITPAPQPGIGVVNQRVDSTSNNGRLERSVKGCVPFALQLTDLSQGARDSVRFYHNNQPLSSLSLNFSSTGNHTITQRVYGSTGCITTDTLRITIRPKPSLSSLFTDTLKSCGSVRLRLRASFLQTDSVKLTWNLPGGSTTTTGQAASNNWSNLSTMITQGGTVQWTMRLMSTGCEDTASRNYPLAIRPPTQAGLLANDTLVCFGKQAQLQNTTTQADSLWLGTQAPGSTNYSFTPITPNSTSFQPTLTTSGIWRFQLATSSVEGCKDTSATELRVLNPLAFIYQYRDSALCGRVIRTLTLQSSDSLTLSEGGTAKGRLGPNTWRFELSGTDSLRLRVKMANARCDTTVNLTIAYRVRPAASLTFRTDSLRACLPFTSRYYVHAKHTDSLYWQTAGGWNAITPLPDSSQQPFNWTLPFTTPYSGPLQLRFTSVEGCRTDTLVGNLALKSRPTLWASLSPNIGCKPLEAVLSTTTTNTDSLLIQADSLNLIRLNPTTTRINLRFWSNDRLRVTATNGLCATDTSLPIQINGFDNRPGLRLTATRADSVGGKEQIRLFWEALPMRKFYRIERSTDSVNWRFLTDLSDNSWLDALAEVSQPWWYRVTAYDSCGNAAYAFQPMRHLALNSRWTSSTQERIELTSLGTELTNPIQLHRLLLGGLPLRQDSLLVSAPLNREEGADWQLDAEEMAQLSYLRYYLTQNEGGYWRRSNTRIDTLSSKLFLPTSFTPNGDGLNEVLRPIGIGLSDIRMEVWNRWGEQVYEGRGPNVGWNGQHRGQPAPQGHYLIRLQATTTTGQLWTEEKSVWKW